jgi:carbamoyltransferase
MIRTLEGMARHAFCRLAMDHVKIGCLDCVQWRALSCAPRMNVVGISAHYHDSACTVLKDGAIVAAASEERFSRFKYDARVPVMAFRYGLEAAGIGVEEIDVVGYYEDPTEKLSRQLHSRIPRARDPARSWLDPSRAVRELREVLGIEAPIEIFDHHLSHAASAFLYSGFDHAAILTVDGVGEWATTTYAEGRGHEIRVLDEVRFPASLGLLYSTITSYLGFRVLGGEYKVMGLAPYGNPSFVPQIERLVSPVRGGQYSLDMRYFDFCDRERMYTDRMIDLFEVSPRTPESEILEVHADLARSVQLVLEERLLALAAYLRGLVDSPNLCMAGGVALNCVANSRILAEGPFKELFVQPAAGDAGASLGAAALAHVRSTGSRPSKVRLDHVYFGPSYSSNDIAHLLRTLELEAIDFRGREDALLEEVAARLERGEVVGWFCGRMEFGPRALGARSILATPSSPRMREHLNRLVKKRESFRPFAPAVLEAKMTEHLELDHPSPFMLETCRVRSPLDLPAITHVDGSCRPQTVRRETNPRFHRLLESFERRTGCPMLVNTSFNLRGEPIVCSPADAIRCFAASEIDCLVLEEFVIPRENLDPRASLLAEATRPQPGRDVFTREPADHVYTFI